ncbi:MAG: hypothetical protein WB558_00200 [Terriglobales bacterium]
MRNTTLCLLMVLFGSCGRGSAQSEPKLIYPKIVATFHRVNQTNVISPVTLYTPKKWGMFRVSIVMVGIKGTGNSQQYLVAPISFTDEAAPNQYPCPFCAVLYTSDSETDAADLPIRAKPGTPIKFSVQAPDGYPAGTGRLRCVRG